jgi:hypothetical protein
MLVVAVEVNVVAVPSSSTIVDISSVSDIDAFHRRT